MQQPLQSRLCRRSEPHIEQRRLCTIAERRHLRIRLLLSLRCGPARRARHGATAALPRRCLHRCGGGPQHLLHLGAHCGERPRLQLPKLDCIARRVRVLLVRGRAAHGPG